MKRSDCDFVTVRTQLHLVSVCFITKILSVQYDRLVMPLTSDQALIAGYCVAGSDFFLIKRKHFDLFHIDHINLDLPITRDEYMNDLYIQDCKKLKSLQV